MDYWFLCTDHFHAWTIEIHVLIGRKIYIQKTVQVYVCGTGTSIQHIYSEAQVREEIEEQDVPKL